MALDQNNYKRMTKKDKLKAIIDGKSSIFLSQEEAKEILNDLNDSEEFIIATRDILESMKNDNVELNHEYIKILEKSYDLSKRFKIKKETKDLSWLKD